MGWKSGSSSQCKATQRRIPNNAWDSLRKGTAILSSCCFLQACIPFLYPSPFTPPTTIRTPSSWLLIQPACPRLLINTFPSHYLCTETYTVRVSKRMYRLIPKKINCLDLDVSFSESILFFLLQGTGRELLLFDMHEENDRWCKWWPSRWRRKV